MIFEKIVLNNFGIYKGHHQIELTPPSPKKAIILLGGLNGSGKTTLLDALQLTLYGKFAKYSNRGNSNYFDYLGRMINYHADPSQGASLELQFKHFRDSKEESIHIHRSWHSTGKGIKETLEVERDGILDLVLTDNWYEYVEEFIPSRISNLFFFDGEKIEALADREKTADLLRIGIHALLGLDLVDRLSTDLLTVERNKRKSLLESKETKEKIIARENKIKALDEKILEIVEQRNEALERLKAFENQLQQLENEYRREGGELFEQRTLIESKLEEAHQKHFEIEEQLRELAAGDAPLNLLKDLLRETEKQAILERQAQHYRELQDELEKRDAVLLELLKEHKVKKSALAAIEAFMVADKKKRQKYLEIECYLNIDATVFLPLHQKHFEEIQASVEKLSRKAEQAQNNINAYEQQITSIPDPESLEGITERIDKQQENIKSIKTEINFLENELMLAKHEIAKKKNDLTQLYETEARESFLHEVTGRVITHSNKVRHTLEKFGIAMTKKHIRRLEYLILESFHQMIRKNQFINKIEIDPNSYSLTVYTASNERVLPESLSAGERQLLAVSILWGLSRASGRPLPAIIDTPLSRLDGKHRQNLVDNYFHQASHQVILLSTDEEINEKYYKILKPTIGREYHITYDDKKQSAIVKDGYFF
jgi:DNA sulfur modification protein DndD